MAEYIDRQAAIDVLHGYFDGMLETDTVCPADIYGLFECIPSADAVEVVRCKDCAEYQEKFRWCKLHDGEMQLEDYCSYGERKPDETD